MALKAGICKALNTETLRKLRNGGIKTATDFLTKDPEWLAHKCQLAYKDISSIWRVLLAEHSACPVSGASLYQIALSSLAILSTGCESLDLLLDGGLYTGEITELAGDSASGKTRICLLSAATTVNTGNQSVVYIDTCSSFSVESILDVLTEDPEYVRTNDEAALQTKLQQVKYVPVFDVFNLFPVLESLITDLQNQDSDEYGNLKLLIVDNMATLINPIMGGHIAYSQGMLSQAGLKLKQLAVNFSIAVLVTNSMVSSLNGTERKPALGKAWSHVPHTRLVIKKCGGIPFHSGSGLGQATLVKSCRQHTPAMALLSLAGEDKPERSLLT